MRELVIMWHGIENLTVCAKLLQPNRKSIHKRSSWRQGIIWIWFHPGLG